MNVPRFKWLSVTDPSQLGQALDWVQQHGLQPIVVHLAAFRKHRAKQPPDAAAFDALDVDLFRDQLYVLVEEKEIVSLPVFDEATGQSRPFGGPEVGLGVRDVLVVVGAHADDRRLWEGLLSEDQVWRP